VPWAVAKIDVVSADAAVTGSAAIAPTTASTRTAFELKRNLFM